MTAAAVILFFNLSAGNSYLNSLSAGMLFKAPAGKSTPEQNTGKRKRLQAVKYVFFPLYLNLKPQQLHEKPAITALCISADRTGRKGR
jgi:hypothetical protein